MDIFEKVEAGAYDVTRPEEITPTGRKKVSEGVFIAARDKYHKACGDALKAFRADAIEYAGLTGHPRADKAFDFAKDHASGRRETVEFLSELADLMKD